MCQCLQLEGEKERVEKELKSQKEKVLPLFLRIIISYWLVAALLYLKVTLVGTNQH